MEQTGFEAGSVFLGHEESLVRKGKGESDRTRGLCGVARRGCGHSHVEDSIRKAGRARIAVIWSEGGIRGQGRAFHAPEKV